MTIGTITLTFANGVVLSGGVSFSEENGQVFLPDRLKSAIGAVVDEGAVHEATLAAGDREYRVDVVSHLTYFVDLASPPSKAWVFRAVDSLLRPTVAQRQQMGRSLHSLAIASLGGAVGLAHSYGLGFWTVGQELTVWGLILAFVLLFAQGSVLMEPSK
ncbi:conserved protein of unknown function (plasmid) [Pararobbsia alpina]|uniref:hypothetical protein n=1 Tax=Pararobbsia alpina TaxID=621374 RepID=UPI0039A61E07